MFRVPTREVDGRSLDLVVKNCRVGEDVPMDTHTLQAFINTEFNSPWEEFALVMELREGQHGPADLRIATQEPLAIYVPPERMQEWQTGRSEDRMQRIQRRHPGMELDILKQYKLIYAWIPGRNVVETLGDLGAPTEIAEELPWRLNERVLGDLEQKGYTVADMKPVHIILSTEDLARVQAAGSGAGPAVEALVVRCLGATAPAVRRPAAVLCSRRLFGDSVITALLPLLDDADKEVQAQAIKALALAADFQIVAAQEALCALVREHKSPAVRNAALQDLLPALRAQKGTVAFDPPFAQLLETLRKSPGPAMQKVLDELK